MTNFTNNGLNYSFYANGGQVGVKDNNGELIAIAEIDLAQEYWSIFYYDEHGEIMDLFSTNMGVWEFPTNLDLAIWLSDTHLQLIQRYLFFVDR